MCGADIPDLSELEGIGKEGDRKRHDIKDPDRTPATTPPTRD
jgi:hypothetical protein